MASYQPSSPWQPVYSSGDPGATPPTVRQPPVANPPQNWPQQPQAPFQPYQPEYRPQQPLEPYRPYQPYPSPQFPDPSVYSTPPYVTVARPAVSGALVAVAWVVALFTLFYMLPWAVAVTRNRSNMAAVGLLNFFLGWSFIGWVASLVLACGSENATQVVVVNQHPQPNYYR